MKKKIEPFERALLVGREAGRRGVTGERLPDFGRHGGRHVGVDAEQFRRRLHAHLLGDDRAPIAALRHEPLCSRGASSARSRRGRCGRDPSRSWSACRRSRSPASTGSRRRKRPLRSRHAPWDRSSGSMIFSCSTTEPGQPCVTMIGSAFSCFERTWMKWMSSPSISVMKFGRAFSLRLAFAPVVFGRPVAREFLHRRELHALRCIRDRFPLRPLCRVDPPAQFGEVRFRNIHMKRMNRVYVG